jgi:RNA polymerase sigma-70 factor, ECF subfamily
MIATQRFADRNPLTDSLREWIDRMMMAAAADANPQTGESTESVGRSRRTPPHDPATIERFRELMVPQLDAAYNLARHLTRDETSAEDIVQDAYVRALAGFANYRGGDPKAWMLTIVRNCSMTWLKSSSTDRKRVADDVDVHDLDAEGAIGAQSVGGDDAPTPESELEGAEEAGVLRNLMTKISPVLREVLILRELEDMSYRQIAAVIDAPIGTVMSRLARARTQLALAYRQFSATGGQS